MTCLTVLSDKETLRINNVSTHSWMVASQLPVRYTIYEQDNLFALDNTILFLGERSTPAMPLRRCIVIDQQVEQIYGQQIRQFLEHHQVEYRMLALPSKEQLKTMEAVFKITEALDSLGINRRKDPIIGIGGGVLLDIVGLTASLYRRGTPYIRIPTTLLGIVDAGIGVKTGVNFRSHKNRLGTYFAPVAAFLDRTFIRSLDGRHICNGLAEIVKMALVADAELFALLEQHSALLIDQKFQDTQAALPVIRRAVQSMLADLAPNLWEHELNRRVDFGHSFSPKLEMMALPELLHGEAVAVDMAISTVLAAQRGLISGATGERVLSLFAALQLPTFHPLCTPEFLASALEETVRHRNGCQRLPLTVALGEADFFNDITTDELARAAATLERRTREPIVSA